MGEEKMKEVLDQVQLVFPFMEGFVQEDQPGWPLQNPPLVATPKSPTCEGGGVGS